MGDKLIASIPMRSIVYMWYVLVALVLVLGWRDLAARCGRALSEPGYCQEEKTLTWYLSRNWLISSGPMFCKGVLLSVEYRPQYTMKYKQTSESRGNTKGPALYCVLLNRPGKPDTTPTGYIVQLQVQNLSHYCASNLMLPCPVVLRRWI